MLSVLCVSFAKENIYLQIKQNTYLMGLSQERIFRRIIRRVDWFSIRSHTLNDLRFFPSNSYRTNNVLNVNIPYHKLKENLSIAYRGCCRQTNNLCIAIMRSLLEAIRWLREKSQSHLTL